MSINKVVLRKNVSAREIPFDMLPGETLQYRTASSRQSFSVQLHNSTSAIKVNVKASDGHIVVTNQRLVYVTEAQGDLDSFVFEFATVAQLQFSHTLKSPWFGANYWEFLFASPGSPVCDGFPKDDWFKGQIVFKDGGLFEFVAVLDRVLNDVVNNKDIDDELPSYSPY